MAAHGAVSGTAAWRQRAIVVDDVVSKARLRSWCAGARAGHDETLLPAF